MKSVVYWSVALPALLAAAPAFAGHDSPDSVPYGAEYAPTAPYDDGAYSWDDRVYSQQDAQTGVYDGTWTGNYVDDQGQIYQGEWQGTYVDENGQAYEGSYRGTSVGEPRYGYDTSGGPMVPYRDNGYDGATGYDGPHPAEPAYGYERRDNGVGGAVIGGVVGGVAGNVIAGRGNRLAGTLIGGGVGAAAGYAIDRAEDDGRYDRRGYTYGRPMVRERRIVRRGPAPMARRVTRLRPIRRPAIMARPPAMAGRAIVTGTVRRPVTTSRRLAARPPWSWSPARRPRPPRRR